MLGNRKINSPSSIGVDFVLSLEAFLRIAHYWVTSVTKPILCSSNCLVEISVASEL